VEVSPRDLPYADVVLHVPGALTLAVSCKDRCSLNAADLIAALNVIRGKLDAGALLHKHLVSQTRTAVTPVLCLSHTWGSGPLPCNDHRAAGAPLPDASGISNRVLAALGNDCILVHGTAEQVHPAHVTNTKDVNAIRIHNVRRNLLQFDFRERESMLPVVIAAVSDFTRDDVTTSVYNGQQVDASQIGSPNAFDNHNHMRSHDLAAQHCDPRQHNRTQRGPQAPRRNEGRQANNDSAVAESARPAAVKRDPAPGGRAEGGQAGKQRRRGRGESATRRRQA
jgi:hypothetical protein